MFVLEEETTVNYPTTVKVTLTFVDDDQIAINLSQGNNILIEITLNDKSGHQYICKYDSENVSNCQHMKLVPDVADNNQLFLMLEGEYNLHGMIYASGKVRVVDPDYTGGYDESYYQCSYTNLKTKDNDCQC